MFSHFPLQHPHQLRSLASENAEKGISMIRVYVAPLFLEILEAASLVFEVAPIAVAAVPFLREGVASLGLIRSIVFHVNP